MLISPLLAKLDFGDAILQVVAYDNGQAPDQGCFRSPQTSHGVMV
jgi:hypothetical protein